MKKVAESDPGSHLHVVCPFCGFAQTWLTEMKWCGGCYVEFYEDRQGRTVFDDKRKTPRFAFAKALGRAGGCQIGSK